MELCKDMLKCARHPSLPTHHELLAVTALEDIILIMNPLTKNPQIVNLAKRYVWWETPDWALQHPTVFLANLMNLGNWDDIQLARHLLGDHTLKQALLEAPPGYFSYRSWDYWNLKLGIKPIPPLPKRDFL